jgi:tripartite-type tricarboxylate transporter receptor subunit TctC
MRKVAALPEVKEQFASQGLAPTASASPDEFAKLIREDYHTIGKVIKAAGIKPE